MFQSEGLAQPPPLPRSLPFMFELHTLVLYVSPPVIVSFSPSNFPSQLPPPPPPRPLFPSAGEVQNQMSQSVGELNPNVSRIIYQKHESDDLLEPIKRQSVVSPDALHH